MGSLSVTSLRKAERNKIESHSVVRVSRRAYDAPVRQIENVFIEQSSFCILEVQYRADDDLEVVLVLAEVRRIQPVPFASE
jgi:hypothetical protein